MNQLKDMDYSLFNKRKSLCIQKENCMVLLCWNMEIENHNEELKNLHENAFVANDLEN